MYSISLYLCVCRFQLDVACGREWAKYWWYIKVVYFHVFLAPGVIMCDHTQREEVSRSCQFWRINCSIRAGAALWVETHHVFLSLSEKPRKATHTHHTNKHTWAHTPSSMLWKLCSIDVSSLLTSVDMIPAGLHSQGSVCISACNFSLPPPQISVCMTVSQCITLFNSQAKCPPFLKSSANLR